MPRIASRALAVTRHAVLPRSDGEPPERPLRVATVDPSDAVHVVDLDDPAIVVPVSVMQAVVEHVVRCAFDEALAARVAELVGRQLATVTSPIEVFSSSKRGPHFPGKSRRWMVRHLPSIPGARKVGRDWQITRADYERWMTEQDVQECRSATAKAPTNAREIALKALAKAGLRPTHKG